MGLAGLFISVVAIANMMWIGIELHYNNKDKTAFFFLE
jgi:hypothetical protein